MSNESQILNSVVSNDFKIKFEYQEPPTQIVYVPTPSGGSSSTIPVALKIISPGEVSVFGEEKVIIPIQLVNTGEKDFTDLSMNASAFKNGDITNKISASFDKSSFKVLKRGQTENLTLEVIFDEEGAGNYEILITAESKYPKYKDSEKIYLKPINDSNTEELMIFTEELIASSPQCIEITEIINEARAYFAVGDYVNADLKTKSALDSCKEAISQVSVPRKSTKAFRVSLYLILSVFIALIIGLTYYFIKRRMLQRLRKPKIKETIKRF